MNQCIIFPNENGGVAVVLPALECLLSIENIGRKDVPQGVPFRIIDVADLPDDRTFRTAWEADFSNPNGYGDPLGYWSELGTIPGEPA